MGVESLFGIIDKRCIMKNILISLFIVFGMISAHAQTVSAGTFITGAKAWYTQWDSAILDWFEQDIAHGFSQNRLTLTAVKDPGEGYLAGPLIGYIKDDGKWSFSFAPMVLSNFNQDWHGTAGSMQLDTAVKLDRIDIDLAANYVFSKNIKFFVGYKYQDMDMDFRLAYTTVMGDVLFNYTLESTVHIPTVGGSVVYPVYDNLVLGLQMGVVYTLPKLVMTAREGSSENIKPYPGLGFNTEISINYKPMENLICQLGYRYQAFEMEARAPGRTTVTKSYDVTHGATFTVIYFF